MPVLSTRNASRAQDEKLKVERLVADAILAFPGVGVRENAGGKGEGGLWTSRKLDLRCTARVGA